MEDKDDTSEENDQIELRDLTAINKAIDSYVEKEVDDEDEITSFLNTNRLSDLQDSVFEENNTPQNVNQMISSELLQVNSQDEVERQCLNQNLPNDNTPERTTLTTDTLKNLSNNHPVYFFGLLITSIITLGAIGTLALIFKTIEYPNMALSRNKLTGRLHDQTYTYGFHFLMPWNELITFDATSHRIEFKELRLLTTDQLQVKINVVIYYFLEKQDLSKIYRLFGHIYQSIARNLAKSTLINEAQMFSVKDFRVDRLRISKTLQDKITDKLRKNYIRMTHFYLQDIRFTKLINDRNLNRVLNGILNERAEHEKTRRLFKAETNVLVQEIKLKARKEIEMAQIQAKYDLIRKSQIYYDTQMKLVEISGLNSNFNQLNFMSINQTTNSQYFMTYCYADMLLKKQNIILMTNNLDSIKFIQ